MGMKKRAIMLISVMLIVMFSLSGCVAFDLIKNIFGGFDAKSYVQGTLDCAYKGQYSSSYMKTTGQSEQELTQMHSQEMDSAAEAFANYFSVETLTDSTIADFADLFSEIYSHAKYEVGKAEKQSDGNYLVTLTLYPMDILQQADENGDVDAYVEDFNQRAGYGEFDTLTNEEYEDEWAAGIIDLLSSYVGSIGYGDAKTIQVRVEKSADDNLYYINSDDFVTIDTNILTVI